MQQQERLLRFLNRHSFFPLLAGSFIVLFFYLVRVDLAGRFRFGFLLWNLLLAWIPYFFSLLAIVLFEHGSKPGHRMAAIISMGLWLLFLPNAPYILTDFIHLKLRDGVPLVFDALFISTIAFTGLNLGTVSLHSLHRTLAKIIGHRAARAVAFTAIGLSGIGVYLGRYFQWNSWDIIGNTTGIMKNILALILHPHENFEQISLILMISSLMSVAYWFRQSGRF